MKKNLIQANDLDKVIDIFTFVYLRPGVTKQDVADYCGFTLRQSDYYLGACVYLDLLDKNMKPTIFAKTIFDEYNSQVEKKIYERIITDELFGKVFARLLLFPESNVSEFARSLVEENYPEYSNAVVNRRSDNLVKWCKKILNKINK